MAYQEDNVYTAQTIEQFLDADLANYDSVKLFVLQIRKEEEMSEVLCKLNSNQNITRLILADTNDSDDYPGSLIEQYEIKAEKGENTLDDSVLLRLFNIEHIKDFVLRDFIPGDWNEIDGISRETEYTLNIQYGPSGESDDVEYVDDLDNGGKAQIAGLDLENCMKLIINQQLYQGENLVNFNAGNMDILFEPYDPSNDNYGDEYQALGAGKECD